MCSTKAQQLLTWAIRKLGDDVPLSMAGRWDPSKIMSPRTPSGILIHPTVWPQYVNVTDRTDWESSRSTGLTATCNGRPKPAINDAPLAPTPKPEVEINELAVSDFLLDFSTIYGRICHCLAVKSYLRFRQNRK